MKRQARGHQFYDRNGREVDEFDAHDARGILRDGYKMRVPLLMQDGKTINGGLDPLQRAIAADRQTVGDDEVRKVLRERGFIDSQGNPRQQIDPLSRTAISLRDGRGVYGKPLQILDSQGMAFGLHRPGSRYPNIPDNDGRMIHDVTSRRCQLAYEDALIADAHAWRQLHDGSYGDAEQQALSFETPNSPGPDCNPKGKGGDVWTQKLRTAKAPWKGPPSTDPSSTGYGSRGSGGPQEGAACTVRYSPNGRYGPEGAPGTLKNIGGKLICVAEQSPEAEAATARADSAWQRMSETERAYAQRNFEDSIAWQKR